MTHTAALRALLVLSLAVLSCGRNAPTAEPEYLTINPPSAATSCDGTTCFCSDITQLSGYQTTNTSIMPFDYMGDGTHLVTITFTGPDSNVAHVVPASPCGLSMALSEDCAYCVDGARIVDLPTLASTYGFWGAGTVTFHARAGKNYLLYRHRQAVVWITPMLDSLGYGG